MNVCLALAAAAWMGAAGTRQAEALETAAVEQDAAAKAAADARNRVENWEEQTYDSGTQALDAAHWDAAIAAFDQVSTGGGKRADAALYWKAYAQNKAGQRPAALTTIQALQKTYPQSRWIKEAKALEIEVRQQTGQAPRVDQEADDDLKLMALNSLMGADPEKALPMLEKFLSASSSPKLRERALFVLAQSGSPKAKEILVRTAKEESNPDIQRKAIEYLGLFGGPESRQVLDGLYASADTQVKRTILHTYLASGEKARVLAVAKTEKDPDLRREAIHVLGAMGAQAELSELYKAETAREGKKAIIQALAVGGAADRVGEMARGEKDAELRQEAIRSLGIMGPRTAATLTSLYASETDVEAKRAILQALFIQGNAEALIDVARKEKDPQLRKEAVTHLSHLNSKAATDFMLEILNK
jgi:HEAT repeat protein